MKNKKKTFVIIGVLVAVVLIIILAVLFSKWKTAREVAELLQPILNAKNQSMHMAVSMDAAGEEIYMESDLYMITEEDSKYIIMQYQDYAFYIVDGMFILENGNAYKLSAETETETVADASLFQQILLMSDYVDIAKVEVDGKVHYSMSITGDDLKELLEILRLKEFEELDALKELKLNVWAKDGSLEKIAIVGATKFEGEEVNITILLSKFGILEEDTNFVPKEIKEIVQTVDKDTLFDLSKDLYRLISASYEFANRDVLEGEVELEANCGIITFKKDYQLSDLRSGGTPVTNAEEVEAIPAGIAFICLEGDISCVQGENQYIYTLELDEEDMEKLVETIAPEVSALVLNLTSGKALVTIENGIISGVEIQINGALNMLVTEIDASVGAKFIFE